MFKNNLTPPPPQKKIPHIMFKPNATMITMTADDATMNTSVGIMIFLLKTHFRVF